MSTHDNPRYVNLVDVVEAVKTLGHGRGPFCTRWGVWLPGEGPYGAGWTAHNECPASAHEGMLNEGRLLAAFDKLPTLEHPS